MGLLWSLLIGCVAGLLAGLLMRDRSFGILWNTILGLVGGLVGGWVFSLFGVSEGSGFVGQLVVAFVGACVILLIANLFRKKK